MNKEYLYSPWRSDYIRSPKPEDCILCRWQDTESDAENLIFYRGRFCYAMLNRYPYNNGHIMLVPYRHCASLSELKPEELAELGYLAQQAEIALKSAYACEGVNLGMNLGKAAGAGIDAHLHLHMVPRWSGDCNFMSVIGGQRVIPEAFETSFSSLRDAFAKLLDGKE